MPPLQTPSISQTIATPHLALGKYRHYKGLEYQVIGVAHHSETLEPLVIYRALYGEAGLWVRPYAMFCETVVVEGLEQLRFAPIDTPAPNP